jgi:hypothetical protein
LELLRNFLKIKKSGCFGFFIVKTVKIPNLIFSSLIVVFGSIFGIGTIFISLYFVPPFFYYFYYSIYVIVVVKGDIRIIIMAVIVFSLALIGILSLVFCQFSLSFFGFFHCFAFLFKCGGRDILYNSIKNEKK